MHCHAWFAIKIDRIQLRLSLVKMYDVSTYSLCEVARSELQWGSMWLISSQYSRKSCENVWKERFPKIINQLYWIHLQLMFNGRHTLKHPHKMNLIYKLRDFVHMFQTFNIQGEYVRCKASGTEIHSLRALNIYLIPHL